MLSVGLHDFSISDAGTTILLPNRSLKRSTADSNRTMSSCLNKLDRTYYCSCYEARFSCGGGTSVYAINTVLSNEIWFVLGMSINWQELSWVKPQFGVILSGLFLVLSILPIDFWGMSFVFGIIACAGVVMMLYKTKDDSPLARYTLRHIL